MVLLADADLFLDFDGYDCGFATIDGALIHIITIRRKALEFDSNQRGQLD